MRDSGCQSSDGLAVIAGMIILYFVLGYFFSFLLIFLPLVWIYQLVTTHPVATIVGGGTFAILLKMSSSFRWLAGEIAYGILCLINAALWIINVALRSAIPALLVYGFYRMIS